MIDEYASSVRKTLISANTHCICWLMYYMQFDGNIIIFELSIKASTKTLKNKRPTQPRLYWENMYFTWPDREARFLAFCEKSDIFARIRYYIIPANHDLSITRVLHVPVIFNLTWYTRIRVKRVLYGVGAHANHVYYKGQLKRVIHKFAPFAILLLYVNGLNTYKIRFIHVSDLQIHVQNDNFYVLCKATNISPGVQSIT